MKQMETDLVVIGGGTGGLAAGLTAMQNGLKKLILLEKRINYGGNSSLAGGFLFGAESRLQKKTSKLVYKDEVCRRTLANNHYDRVNPRQIRALINSTGEMIDWLEDQGVVFKTQTFMEGTHQIKGKFTEEIEKRSMGVIQQYSLVMEILANKITEKGGQILLRTAAKKILRDEKGKISGVVAATRDGEEISIKCKSVILAPGGFTGNRELLMKYFGYDDFATEAMPLMGDGIKMAEDAGAYMEEYATMCAHGVQPKYVSLETIKNQPNRHILSGPMSVWVNSKGQRFIGTGSATGQMIAAAKLILRQPGKVAYSIIDEKILEAPMPHELAGMPGGEIYDDAKQNAVRLRKELQEVAKGGKYVYISDSWDDIAKYVGAVPRILRATIDEYNAYCDSGLDPIFGREKQCLMPLRNPPYYAIKLQPGIVEAIGPVRVNEYMEVLDKQEDPIPGFYAVGAITSGWCGQDYDIGGSNLGFATAGGRIAGEKAVKYLTKK